MRASIAWCTAAPIPRAARSTRSSRSDAILVSTTVFVCEGGVLADECAALLRRFFESLRAQGKK